MPPPKMSTIPIAKSILYDKRILLANLKRRSLTEKNILPKLVIYDGGKKENT